MKRMLFKSLPKTLEACRDWVNNIAPMRFRKDAPAGSTTGTIRDMKVTTFLSIMVLVIAAFFINAAAIAQSTATRNG